MYRGVPDALCVTECGKKSSLGLSFRFRNQPFFGVKQKMIGLALPRLAQRPNMQCFRLGFSGK